MHPSTNLNVHSIGILASARIPDRIGFDNQFIRLVGESHQTFMRKSVELNLIRLTIEGNAQEKRYARSILRHGINKMKLPLAKIKNYRPVLIGLPYHNVPLGFPDYARGLEKWTRVEKFAGGLVAVVIVLTAIGYLL